MILLNFSAEIIFVLLLLFESIIILSLILGLNFCLLSPLCALITLFCKNNFFGLTFLKLKIDSKFLSPTFVKFCDINSSKKIFLKLLII